MQEIDLKVEEEPELHSKRIKIAVNIIIKYTLCDS